MADSLVETVPSTSSHLNVGGGMNTINQITAEIRVESSQPPSAVVPSSSSSSSSSGSASGSSSLPAGGGGTGTSAASTSSSSTSSTTSTTNNNAPHNLSLSDQNQIMTQPAAQSDLNLNIVKSNEKDQLKCGAGGGVGDENDDDGEPEIKRRKITNIQKIEKLELRLGGILCCAVCLDLPRTVMYQCSLGHLMCAACFTHLLADGRLRDQNATCPNCRTEISKSNASRNLAVEKAVSELPSECQFCCKEFPTKSIENHENNECEERPTDCKYVRIGCQWRGPMHESIEHEQHCAHPKKSGADVMIALQSFDKQCAEDKKLFSTLIDLLSYEKIIFNDLQMKPYRTDEYVHRLFYETSRFSAFNYQWVVKAIINKSQREPHQSCERDITYQLILKSKPTTTLSLHFFILKGPFSDMKVNTQIYKHDFTETETESPYNLLPLPDTAECNRLLAAKAINFRLIMFLASK
uniref:Protein ubiquitination n=1 Tax=Corethrella appendiculata TaxID=1370023 RepID=U5EYI2_9DIPT